MAEFIYQMWKVRKAPSDKVMLDGDTLSFGPAANIGVVGPNGAHATSMPRILSMPGSPRCCANSASIHAPQPPPNPRASEQESVRRPSYWHLDLKVCSKQLRCNKTCANFAASINQNRGL
jgi:hypothetical protein